MTGKATHRWQRVPCVGRIRPFASRLMGCFERRALVLAYHRVKPSAEMDPFQLTVTTSRFEEQIAWLVRVMPVVAMSDLVNELSHGRLAYRRQVAITFDDGYFDNVRYAAPILRKCNLPATVYLTTGYIGTQRLFWWDELVRLVFTHQAGRLEVDAPVLKTYTLTDEQSRTTAVADMVRRLRIVPEKEREQTLARLSPEGRPSASEVDRAMSWEEARSLLNQRIEIGAHTCHHQALNSMEEGDALREIETSRRAAEARLGRPIIHFSYPHDDEDYGRQHLSEKSRALVIKAGFRSGVTIVQGVNKADQDLMALRRFTVRNWDGQEFVRRVKDAFLTS